MRTNHQYLYLPWVCPACDTTNLIDPEEPEFYCSINCEGRAAHAIAEMLAPSAKASRYLVKHLRYYYEYRHEIADSGERGRLANEWANALIDALNIVIDIEDRRLTVESLVFDYAHIYPGGKA